ncbi:MAG: flagellin [Lachnospiraceae bacterium]|nr:flagellin [Lachnospiraceae bacterium]
MVVQHNLTAMNSNRMLGITSKSQAKATEKLSSGYKINRAADDAAGLSISEKMRKQIRGLTQASANAQDGISAVQTAEGALTEVHDMLQRMNELAVKAANGTNSKDDRAYIQAEVDQLVTEIDRVATTTKFNESYLLKGTNNDGNVGKLTYTTAAADTGLSNIDASTGEGKGTYTAPAKQELTADDYFTNKLDGYSVNDKPSYDKSTYVVGENTYILVDNIKNGTQKKDTDVVALNTSYDKIKAELLDGATKTQVFESKEDLYAAIKKDANGSIKSLKEDGTDLIVSTFADLNKGLDVSLHVGADSTKDNKIGLTIEMMSARGLGVNGIRVYGADDKNATASIDTIKAAIQKVSEQRSALGAVQNRLDHTINNLDNVVENTTSAASAIRDTDMATQMVSYSNNNILAQAGQAMLAQANQATQGVLSILG